MLETIEHTLTRARVTTAEQAGLILASGYLEESKMVTPEIRLAFDDLDSALDDLSAAWHGKSNLGSALDSLDEAEARLLGNRVVSNAFSLMTDI